DGRILLPQKVVVLPSEPPEGDAESWKQLVLDTEGFFHVVGAPDPVRWSTRRADAEQLVVARSDFVVLHNAVAPARCSDQCGITGGDARNQCAVEPVAQVGRDAASAQWAVLLGEASRIRPHALVHAALDCRFP